MIDGVLALLAAENISLGEVTAIDVRVSPAAARFTDVPRPTTRMQAKFSLRHCAVAAVAFGRVGTPELEQEVLVRPDIVELRDRVKVVADPALGKQDADVEITLASGGRCRPRYAGTGARPPRRCTTTSSAPSSATWSVQCSARIAPERFSRPVGTLTNSPTCRCCWLRPCPH